MSGLFLRSKISDRQRLLGCGRRRGGRRGRGSRGAPPCPASESTTPSPPLSPSPQPRTASSSSRREGARAPAPAPTPSPSREGQRRAASAWRAAPWGRRRRWCRPPGWGQTAWRPMSTGSASSPAGASTRERRAALRCAALRCTMTSSLCCPYCWLEGQAAAAAAGAGAVAVGGCGRRLFSPASLVPWYCRHGEEEVLDLWAAGRQHQFRRPVVRRWQRTGAADRHAGTVVTPMPGKIVKVGGRALLPGASACVLPVRVP